MELTAEIASLVVQSLFDVTASYGDCKASEESTIGTSLNIGYRCAGINGLEFLQNMDVVTIVAVVGNDGGANQWHVTCDR